jgi:hypothetical protein
MIWGISESGYRSNQFCSIFIANITCAGNQNIPLIDRKTLWQPYLRDINVFDAHGISAFITLEVYMLVVMLLCSALVTGGIFGRSRIIQDFMYDSFFLKSFEGSV